MGGGRDESPFDYLTGLSGDAVSTRGFRAKKIPVNLFPCKL